MFIYTTHKIFYILIGYCTWKIMVFALLWGDRVYKMKTASQSSILGRTHAQNMFNFVYDY
jgi:hypothetical protein